MNVELSELLRMVQIKICQAYTSPDCATPDVFLPMREYLMIGQHLMDEDDYLAAAYRTTPDGKRHVGFMYGGGMILPEEARV